MVFGFMALNVSAQELELKSKDTIPAKLKDSIPIQLKDSVFAKTDSLLIKPADSIQKPVEILETIIEHSADSLIRQDLANNKIILFKNARIHYKDIDLTAGYIEIDNNTNLISAKGIKDSVGKYSQLPVFKQGQQESTQDSIVFNFKSG